MKKDFQCAALFLLLIQANLSTISAQGTAFTYQGRLNSGGGTANGSYDMVFSLHGTNVAGSIIAGPVTNSAVVVTNGVFSTAVDFGAGAFSSGNNWLEIAVRTNGTTAFTILSPRQLLTPTPYASYAANANSAQVAASANSVSATNISGTIPLSHISTAVLTNNGTGVNLSGSFGGNGAGLTNLNVPGVLAWQIVPGTAVQTASNTGYVVTNDLPVRLTLPASPAIGDVVRVTGAGTGGWEIARNPGQFILTTNLSAAPTNALVGWKRGVSVEVDLVVSSADGSHLVAGNGSALYYTSSDSGATWVKRFFLDRYNAYLSRIVMTADGSKVVAIGEDYYNGLSQIYMSTDLGVTWTLKTNNLPPNYMASRIACSADGMKLAAGIEAGFYTSDDSGLTWTQQTNESPVAGSISLSWSADLTKFLAGCSGPLYVSTDSGVTWTAPAGVPNSSWDLTAMSADGTKMAALGGAGLYISTNSGATWTVQPGAPSNFTRALVFVPDGTKLILVSEGQIYSSTDMGATWLAMPNSPTVYSVAPSHDGSQLLAGGYHPYGNGIYVYRSQWTVHGGLGDSIELQYIGKGLFAPISYVGSISSY